MATTARCSAKNIVYYNCQIQAMSGHDGGGDRGGVAKALARITARVRVVSVSSDRPSLSAAEATGDRQGDR